MFWRDSFLVSGFTLVIIWFISIIPLNTHFLDPVSLAVSDFDPIDIYYSRIKLPPIAPGEIAEKDNRIVLVNIKDAHRGQIAEMLEYVNSNNPAVIGLDVMFAGPKDSVYDLQMQQVLKNNAKIICSSLLNIGKHGEVENVSFSDFLLADSSRYGYANFVGNDYSTVRNFYSFTKVGGTHLPSFASAVLKQYKPEVYERFLNDCGHMQFINYGYRYNNLLKIDIDELYEKQLPEEIFAGKIVLFGYTGSEDVAATFEDAHFTPLNLHYAGHTFPDMYGIAIHANIMLMMLDGQEIFVIPFWLEVLFALLIGALMNRLFLYFFLIHHKWFHPFVIIAELLLSVFLFLALVVLFHSFHIKFNLGLIFGSVVLNVYMLDIVSIIMESVSDKKFKTVFHQKH